MPAHGHRIQMDWRDLLDGGLWEVWHLLGLAVHTVMCWHCGRFWDKTFLSGGELQHHFPCPWFLFWYMGIIPGYCRGVKGFGWEGEGNGAF